MAVELTVPQVGESITEVQIGQWLKSEGDTVEKGETLVELETDKVTLELPAPVAGTIKQLLKQGGDSASVGDVIGYLEETQAEAAEPKPAVDAPEKAAADSPPRAAETQAPPSPPRRTPPKEASAPAASAEAAAEPAEDETLVAEPPPPSRAEPARKSPTADRAAAAQRPPARESAAPSRPSPAPAAAPRGEDREEQRVPMTPLRRRVAERLVDAQQTAALLTTFNEVDMTAVMALRARHQQQFQEKHNIKLGIMSFFVKAAVDALKRFPAINAEVQGTDILYRNYYDIGVAVSTDKGLVVPVLTDADRMSFAEIELAIADLGTRARDNKLKLSELEGGTFTITNGGVFGSLLSTPIVNPPQSGILGMHAIQDRPVAREGQVVIRPMMYVALTYDHRIVDGREAVTFLRRIKDVIEEPSRMLIEI
ncbi:MAG: hypothetical protein AMXMBFR13_21770 [Phycisphaerae bacterium]